MKLSAGDGKTELPDRTRRRFLAELAGASIAIAIPAGALIAAARPIANPPQQQSSRAPRPTPTPKVKLRKSDLRIRDDEKRARAEKRRSRESDREDR